MRAMISGRTAMRWLLVGAGLAVVVGANAHLVYVAARSQPDCVQHVRTGEAVRAPGQFSAATSACSGR